MKAETLARLRSIARREYTAVSDGYGVTNTSAVTPKNPEVTPVTPVTPENDKRGNRTAEVCAANLLASEKEDADAVEERAGLAADRVPFVYLDAWARMNCQKPASVSETEWRRALDDSGQFLDAWGNEAAKMGWTPGELFNVTAGLVWRLAGERVEAIANERARLSEGRAITGRMLAKRIEVETSP